MKKKKTKSIKLKPCPFCGQNSALNERDNDEPFSSYKIYCTYGCISMKMISKEELIKAWNKRVG